MTPLPVGLGARVSVAATSANLGPGFDCMGLALDLRDEYCVRTTDSGRVSVVSVGESAEEMPGDDTHLVARSLLLALERAGFTAGGLELECANVIPQGRGLGSSAAAIVGGIALAQALADALDPDAMLALAAEVEGHPDNVAPAVLGGLTVTWTDESTARALRLDPDPTIVPVLFIPAATSPTSLARAALPAQVPLTDAVFNASRSALLVAALTGHPELLLPATADRLHQEQRRSTYPAAMALVDQLRGLGIPAVVSGAGPSVLALTDGSRSELVASMLLPGYTARRIAFGAPVAATRSRRSS